MTCRLYIDEVGNDDLVNESERYLSLTGITTKRRAHDTIIAPAIEEIKREFFGHNPPLCTIVLHRRELVRKEPPFQALQDEETNARWEVKLLRLVKELPYIANTVLIDKHAHVEKYGEWHNNPYHYCIIALIERYVLWLRRHGLTGDVVAEPRFKGEDRAVKEAFRFIYQNGTGPIPSRIVQKHLTSGEIKFEPKASNTAGLQLVEVIANPSHQSLKCIARNELMTATFGRQIVDILDRYHYGRKPGTNQIIGWGQKLLP